MIITGSEDNLRVAMYRSLSWIPCLLIALCVLASAAVSADDAGKDNGGVLDRPLPSNSTASRLSATPVATASIITAGSPEAVQEALRSELVVEQAALKQLPIEKLQEKAESGERAAQVTLAEEFAKEATMLAFAPAAANSALSDAVRWYSMAAMRGFPGAPSLDQAGVHFYPIRVQRAPR